MRNGEIKKIAVMTKARKWRGTVYPARPTEYVVALNADSITINSTASEKHVTFKIGDLAEYGSYNLHYFGYITKISEKTVTIVEQYGRNPEVHRLNLNEFCWRNYGTSVEEKLKQNEITSMSI